jgi:hypothetical protein
MLLRQIAGRESCPCWSPPVRDVARGIFLANYFLRYAFYVVMVLIEVFRVRWTHRSHQSTDSQ